MIISRWDRIINPWEDTFSGGEFITWNICAKAYHPVIWKIISYIVDNIKSLYQGKYTEEYFLKKLSKSFQKNFLSSKTKSILLVSGPIIYTDTILKFFNPDTVKISKPELDSTIVYAFVDHLKIQGKNHYSQKVGPIVGDLTCPI
jgi:hypothetical protein